ncbi:MAG: VOC family protein [Terriglobia bacterium]|jgi:catechol 2,3-dioxygenase-like lactoylglutathione lyase family enzyme
MSTGSPLGSEKIMAFVGTQDAAKARAFYQDTLGLRLISEDHFALAFDAHGIMLRVTNVGKAVVAPYTVLGWEIKDIAATVKALQEAGVKFEHYEGLGQDELGVWHAPGGAKVAWFKDPDGNTLSVTQL